MPSFDSELLSKLPLVDTVVAEALRLSSASIVLREAEEDTTLELSDGRVVSVRRGDHVCLFPQLAHTDPAVFERPDEFNPARFTSGVWLEPVPGADGRSRKGLLLPFGGGSGMCPGRFFAYGEIRCLVALAFYLFDIQIDAPLPELDQTRSGYVSRARAPLPSLLTRSAPVCARSVGILPPKSGMPATLRPRPLPVPVRA
jgi:cholesterol 7alpha-monooxygenase